MALRSRITVGYKKFGALCKYFSRHKGTGISSQYMESMYDLWLTNRQSVHPSWDKYFSQIDLPVTGRKEEIDSNTQEHNEINVEASTFIHQIVQSYQSKGHLTSKLDPLGITELSRQDVSMKNIIGDLIQQLPPESYNKSYFLPSSTYIAKNNERLTLNEIQSRLENIYCGHIGIEIDHIIDKDKVKWLRERFEKPGVMDISAETKKKILHRLVKSVYFENFLARKWPSGRRFGVEGCEVILPALQQIIDRGSEFGIDIFVIGMAHRARLNVMANIVNTPLRKIYAHFLQPKLEGNGSGDVKYHLGAFNKFKNEDTQKDIVVSMVSNPSHLEAINSSVEGKVHAHQYYRGDKYGDTAISILIHGDAAMCGEGVVYELCNLDRLPRFTTHGTIHFVINNQIGFTANPRDSRSFLYCTDVLKLIEAPIFHVNADDPEAVIHCCNVAIDYRNTFKSSVVLDIVGYRVHGHNETEQPMFTQPKMYQVIANKQNIFELYKQKMVNEGIVTEFESKDMVDKYVEVCSKEMNEAEKIKSYRLEDYEDSPWEDFTPGEMKTPLTGVNENTLRYIGEKFSSEPPQELNFDVHPALQRILQRRKQLLDEGKVNMALAEAMAFGSLLKEGVTVRLSGQDTERGTFGHRHHVIHHQSKHGEKYVPLKNMFSEQAEYIVCNTPISELAVLGFELGFSMTNPNSLVIWEAQFGDFANNGQTVYDTMLCCGEKKWARKTGLVVFLPHACEGAGPEHTSGRVERFLQQCDDDENILPDISDPEVALKQLRDINWIVAMCSSPSNFFHLLRRQIKLPFRKPLIVMTGKTFLLRSAEVTGDIQDMVEGTQYKRVIPDDRVKNNPQGVQRHIFCGGQVYYTLVQTRKERNLEDEIVITRLEQICPFPYDLVRKEAAKYPNAHIVWCQEEHRNQGCWAYVKPRFRTALQDMGFTDIYYAGRKPLAASSVFNSHLFKEELELLKDDAFNLEKKIPSIVISCNKKESRGILNTLFFGRTRVC